MLEFEKDVPEKFRKDGVIVKTVGQLIDELSLLPRDLPLSGDMGNGKCMVSVSRHVRTMFGGVSADRLQCIVEGYEDWEDDEDDEFDEDYDDDDDDDDELEDD